MLVMSRTKGESIVIGHFGHEVTVTVAEILGDRVRLVLDAPPEVPVMKKETWIIRRNAAREDD